MKHQPHKQSLLQRIFLKPIALYQRFISPLIGRQCRYMPSCSHFTQKAIKQHGALKGIYLGFWRILSCNPWGGSGIDAVPDEFSFKPYAHGKNSGKTHASVVDVQQNNDKTKQQ